jgi:hypothetical protein
LGARRLAAYMREAAGRLRRQAPDATKCTALDFPDPEEIAIEAAGRLSR